MVDGTALVIRAWFAGTPGGAAAGFVGMLGRLVWAVRPTHLVVVFDAAVKTFRNQIDPSYKANRPDAPPELVRAFEAATEAVHALGATPMKQLGFEADDLMATLARRADIRSTLLIARDKDLFQLVGPTVRVVDPVTRVHYDERAVFDKMGVHPGQIVDYLSLVGDASDNVVGVRGVGAKTACALLGHFGSLDAIYAGVDQVAELPIRGARTLGAKLLAGRADALRSRELVTLHERVPTALGGSPDAFALASPRGGAWVERLAAHRTLELFRALSS